MARSPSAHLPQCHRWTSDTLPRRALGVALTANRSCAGACRQRQWGQVCGTGTLGTLGTLSTVILGQPSQAVLTPYVLSAFQARVGDDRVKSGLIRRLALALARRSLPKGAFVTRTVPGMSCLSLSSALAVSLDLSALLCV